MHLVSSQFSRPPYNDLGRDEELAPLFPPDAPLSMRSWEEQRSTLRQQWDRVLGTPSYGAFDRGEEVVDTFSTSEYSARVFRQRTSPDTRQLVVLMSAARIPHVPVGERTGVLNGGVGIGKAAGPQLLLTVHPMNGDPIRFRFWACS